MAIKTTKTNIAELALDSTMANTYDFGFDTEDFESFGENLAESTSIPYCQIVAPPNIPSATIEQMKPPYGLFLPVTQAEAVEFTPTEDWEKVSLVFGDNDSETTEGYITRHIRFAVLRRGRSEVQMKVNGAWRYQGLAYANGSKTELAETGDSDRENYRTVTRHLLLLLDKDNNPLHSSPIQLSARSAFSASLGTELRDFYKETASVYEKAAKLKGVTLKKSGSNHSFDEQGKAFAVFDAQLGYHKADKKAPFTCIVARHAPAIDQVGVTKVSKRKDKEGKERELTLTGVPLGSVLIKKKSETGAKIQQLFDEYESFSLPNAGKSQDDDSSGATPPTTLSGIAQGWWDDSNDQRYTVLLKTATGERNLYGEGTIAQAIANILDNYEEAQGSFTCQKDGDWLKVLSFNLKDPMEGTGEEF